MLRYKGAKRISARSIFVLFMALFCFLKISGNSFAGFASIAATVTDKDSQGISDVHVVLINPEDAGNNVVNIGTSEGTVFYEAVPPGFWKIHFQARDVGFKDEWYNNKSSFDDADIIEFKEDVLTTIESVLEPLDTGRIQGKVVKTNSVPIEFVYIELYNQNNQLIETVNTDSMGNFLFPGLSDNIYSLALTHPAGCYQTKSYNDIQIVNENEVTGIEITLEETHTCIDGILKGTVQGHLPDAEIPWFWFSYIPNSQTKDTQGFIIVEAYAGVSDYAINTLANYSHLQTIFHKWGEKNGYILLVPSIPLGVDARTMEFFPENFNEQTEDFYQRADLKVNKMVAKLINNLRGNGYKVNSKIFVTGHSLGGAFSQRYSLLHPDKVIATYGGQCTGFLVLPAEYYSKTNSSWNGFKLNWMLGVADLEHLTGYKFDFETYKNIPHFITTHSEDYGLGPYIGHYPDRFDTNQIEFLVEVFRLDQGDPTLLKNQCEYINGLGGNFTYKTYPGGHTTTPEVVIQEENDMLLFFNTFKNHASDKNALSNILLLLLRD